MRMIASGAASFAVLVSACSVSAPLTQDAADTSGYDWSIERDEWGVPTARGATAADASFAIAIAHAEDDFATIQNAYFASKGKAGLLTGESGAASDFLFHLFEVDERLDAYYESSVTPEVKAILEAYADGLNDYAQRNPEEVKEGIWPLTGRDVAGSYLLFSPLFYGVDSAVGGLATGTLDPCAGDIAASDHFRGSNAFAVAPKASKDGSTFILINPHNPWDGPLSWYEARVHSDDGWKVSGGMLAGTPFPSGAAYNDTLAYAPTVNRPDLVDYYLLTTNAGHPDQYLLDGEWTNFRTKNVTIDVQLGEVVVPLSRAIKYSVFGPSFETGSGWVAASYPDYHNAEAALRMPEQYYHMGQSETVSEFLEALEMRAIPSFNYIMADQTGQVGFIYNANLPDRAEGVSGEGCIRGETTNVKWSGILPLEANPKVIDPKSGWVFSANATPFHVSRVDDNPTKAAYPINIGIDDRLTNRARRLSELLSDDAAPFTREYLTQLKFDEAYSAESDMAKFVASTVLALQDDPDFADVSALLSGWDLVSSSESRASLFVHELFNVYHAASWWGGEVPEIKEHVRKTVDSMVERYGRIDPALGDVVHHMRGSVNLPLGGGDDTLRMIRSEYVGDGLRRANYGDGMTFLIEWTSEGEQIVKGFHQYGAALGREGSDHYDDQAGPFVEKQWRVISSLPVPAVAD